MNKIRFIGDVHGKYREYSTIIKEAYNKGISQTIQVGDMEVGFREYDYEGNIVWSRNPPHDLMIKTNSKFLRGNHDNLSVCKNHSQWIKDGTIENDMMFIGGATSIDKMFRDEGLDWWADEECSYNDLQDMIDNYIIAKPRVMVTHEAPESVADEIIQAFNRTKFLDPSRTRQAFQVMLEHHQPEIWIHGHWHESIDKKIGKTRFICLDELECIDLEV